MFAPHGGGLVALMVLDGLALAAILTAVRRTERG
jgi:hypothetical protein